MSIEDTSNAEAKLDGMEEVLHSLERCLCVSLFLSSSIKAEDVGDQNELFLFSLSFKLKTKR